MKRLIAFLSLGLVLSGCVTTGGPNQTAGTLLGGAGGALVGSRFGHGKGRLVSTALGTLGGAMMGGYMGQAADTPPPQQQYAYPPAYAYPPQYQYEPEYYHPPRPHARPHHPRGHAPRRHYPAPQPHYYEHYEHDSYYY